MRTTTVDPLAEKYYSISPYAWCGDNPVNAVDPTGMFGVKVYETHSSTHTDRDGNVVAVINDGDLGVYKHNGDEFDALTDLSMYYSKDNTSAKGTYIGSTYYWDEFLNENSIDDKGYNRNNIIHGARILEGESWDDDVESLFDDSQDESIEMIGINGRPNEKYDIKANRRLAPFGSGTGRKLNGKYVTARSAGNYLAGLNASGKIDFIYFMKIAGALHVAGTDGIINTKFTGHAYGLFPWYGEIPYAGRMIVRGWLASPRKNRIKSNDDVPPILFDLYCK